MECGSTNVSEVKEGESVVPLELLSLVCAGIYNASFTSGSAVIVKITEVLFEKTEGMERFRTGPLKENVDNKVTVIDILKGRLIQSFSDTSGWRKRLARGFLFQKLGYHRLISKFSALSVEEMLSEWEGIVQAQEKLLKKTGW